jgi:trehalose-phosphatase
MTKPLTPVLRRWINTLAQAQHLLLALDFDGTLVRIQRDPQAPILTLAQRTLLRRLANLQHITMAIISGRAVLDVERRVGIPTLCYVGNHGLEIRHRHRWCVRPHTLWCQTMKGLERLLQPLCQEWPGLQLENKGPVLTLHYRNVARRSWSTAQTAIIGRVDGLIDHRQYQLGEGKAVVEVRPRAPMHKGWALRWVRRHRVPLHNVQVVAIGDDRTDEDLFAACRPTDLTIHVGRGTTTQAAFRIGSPAGVWKLLEGLAAVLTRP